MNSCITCGMPFEGEHTNDIGLQTTDGPVCQYDVENGKIKSPEEIFEGGIRFFMETLTNGDRDEAIRFTRKNMNSLPYWDHHYFDLLEGEQASDEEFQEAMKKL